MLEQPRKFDSLFFQRQISRNNTAQTLFLTMLCSNQRLRMVFFHSVVAATAIAEIIFGLRPKSPNSGQSGKCLSRKYIIVSATRSQRSYTIAQSQNIDVNNPLSEWGHLSHRSSSLFHFLCHLLPLFLVIIHQFYLMWFKVDV